MAPRSPVCSLLLQVLGLESGIDLYSFPCVAHDPSIPSQLIWSPKQLTLHYVISCIFPVCPLASNNAFLSPRYSETNLVINTASTEELWVDATAHPLPTPATMLVEVAATGLRSTARYWALTKMWKALSFCQLVSQQQDMPVQTPMCDIPRVWFHCFN